MSVCVVIPVFSGQEKNLALSLRHLHDLEVSGWARIIVVSSPEVVRSACRNDDSADQWNVSNTVNPVWGDLISEGMFHAKKQGAEQIVWLKPGCLPREGTLQNIVELSRCRRALIAPGVVRYTCQSRQSGGMEKSIFGLISKPVNRGAISHCDTISQHLGCLPIDAIPIPETAEDGFRAGFWSAEDLGLILTGNGIPCFVDGESVVDIIRNLRPETESWLLTGRPTVEIWKSFANPASELNPNKRLRFFCRHWGVFGIVPAVKPFARFAVISVLRMIVPMRILRQLFGRRSSAWQLQKIYEG